MNAILKFFRSTLIGGMFFLLPLVLIIVVIAKAIEIAAKIVDPLARELPVPSIIGLPMPVFLALLVILLFCLISGMIARTRGAATAIAALEGGVLTNMPGYEFIKEMAQNILGVTPEHAHETVIVRIDESWQIGFLMVRHDHGFATVFVPDAPSPRTGAVHLISEDRIAVTSVPPAAALKCIRRLGGGSEPLVADLLKSLQTRKSVTPQEEGL